MRLNHTLILGMVLLGLLLSGLRCSPPEVPAGSQYQVLTEGASSVGCGQVNLASTNAVTGTLAAANQSAQTMCGDVSGTTAAAVVTQLQSGEIVTGATSGTLTCAAGATACAWSCWACSCQGFGALRPRSPPRPVTKVEPRVTRFHPTIFEAKARGLIP